MMAWIFLTIEATLDWLEVDCCENILERPLEISVIYVTQARTAKFLGLTKRLHKSAVPLLLPTTTTTTITTTCRRRKPLALKLLLDQGR